MSMWTHVAAIVRVDGFRIFDEQIGPDWDAIFGKECLFLASRDKWDDAMKHPEKYLPMGSEGSLRKTVWTDPDRSHMAAYTVSIFGDLRDYDSPETIIEWFKKIVNSDNLDVRQACITVTNRYKSMTWGINFGKESRASNCWTPCSVKLPDEEGEYLVTNDAGGMKTVETDIFAHYEDTGEPFWMYSQNPIAWMPKPDAYEEK